MHVRRASCYDLESLYKLSKNLRLEENMKWAAHETPYPWQPFDELDKENFAKERLPYVLDDNLLYLVAEDSAGLLIGYMLCSSYTRPVGAPAKVLSVHEFYVEPSFRTSDINRPAKIMTLAAKHWAKSLGCTSVEISCTGAEAQVKFWTDKGYKPFKVMLHKELS